MPAMHPQEKLDRLFTEAKRWSLLWGLSRLMRDVQIEFSDEIGAKAGTCDLTTMTIRLNGVLLLSDNEHLLHETLCHELAHIVASLRYGTGVQEHGVEWADYVTRAGFSPRPVLSAAEIKRR